MIRIITLAAALAFSAATTLAQGYFNGNNGGTGIFITIQDPNLNGGVPVEIGSPATAAGFSGAGRGGVKISLYAALQGTAVSILESSASFIATSNNNGSTGLNGFSTAMRLPVKTGFDGFQPLEFIMYGVDATGKYNGWSTEATGITPTATGAGAPVLFGTGAGLINSFELMATPEPSVLTLAGIGAAAMAMRRRR